MQTDAHETRIVEPPDVDVSKDSDHVDPSDVDSTAGHGDEERTPESAAPEPDDATIDDAQAMARDLDDRYLPDARESVVLPGTDGTVSGTAIADWLDDDKNIIHPEDRGGSS